MYEKDLQSALNKVLARMKVFDQRSLAIESKLVNLSKRKSLPFSEVKPHQRRGLRLAQKKLIYKIPDDSYDQKPFDAFMLVAAIGYVCVFWYMPRKLKEAHLITINDFLKIEEDSKRKSLDYDTSRLFSEYVIPLC